ncbi:type II toxin-antitoxin system mRNA interferase toxin, RelE/StbE family [Candidatus Uhrbacteria bacterium]|nr:type II toxin-antitoxin system mRNA interferase toxin, RelE/StbE family [Candidatus Uhrbacteria bacterium]
MRVSFHKRFKKQLEKNPSLKRKAEERIVLFSGEPFHPILNNHSLTGTWEGYRNINITGDYRAVYRLIDMDVAYFVDMDTHSNLYK